ncbi:hypothetical protein ABD87_14675 [Lysinibacillus sphaericus]|uniref:hypothetical protein n=1 Tax=Lysinibacillus sphaericus TaxID=1421 RepID=UPI0018CCCAE6|nr:hypothetical protein [Lysinibacillus sphaericus]MBG9730745.1 hypothetical protein [Lysinibacillus sphaericus]
MSDITFGVCDSYLTKFEKTSIDGYIGSYLLVVDFSNKNETIGELHITFDIIGYGIEGFEGGIDVTYKISYFSNPCNKHELYDDDEAFIFIFTNYGKDIMTIVDLAYDALDDFYEKGTSLDQFANHFK